MKDGDIPLPPDRLQQTNSTVPMTAWRQETRRPVNAVNCN